MTDPRETLARIREQADATDDGWEPLADLTPGTVIRDVTILGLKEHCDAFILADARGPYVATAHGFYFLPFLTAFTTDDRTIRYTRHGDTWIAENLKEDA